MTFTELFLRQMGINNMNYAEWFQLVNPGIEDTPL